MTDSDKTEPAAGHPETAPASVSPDSGADTEYQVLARKYRPRDFGELIGQEALVKTLTNAIRTGRVAHAFVLTGVRGIGKTTTARIIARALNCVGPDGTGGPTTDPCGVCEHCVAIAEDRHVDVIEMDAASRTGVDDVRELIEGVRYKPVSARYKVYIIDEVHMLSRNAFNALLKTLEEPPEHVKFIFATTEIRKVPITVLSRCQRFDLRRLDAALLGAHLAGVAAKEGAALSEDAIALLARAADGSVRDGLSLLDQVIAQSGTGAEIDGETVRSLLGLADRNQTLDLFAMVMKGDAAGALDLADALYRAGADPLVLLQDMLDLCHTLTRHKLIAGALSAAPGAAALAEKLDVAVLSRAWQMLLKGLGEVQSAPQPIMALEMLLIRLAHVADMPTPAQIIEKLSAENAPSAGSQTEPGAAAAPAGAPVSTGMDAVSAPAPQNGGPPPDQPGDPGPTASGGPSGGPSYGGSPGGPSPARAAPAPRYESAPDALAALDAPPADFAQLVALFEKNKEMLLYSHLHANVHCVRLEPGRLEIRPEPAAPQSLAADVARFLGQWTGERWVVTVSSDPGAPTLREAAALAEAARREAAANDPLVRAVLDAFPGAQISRVREIESPAIADGALDGGADLAVDPDEMPDDD